MMAAEAAFLLKDIQGERNLGKIAGLLIPNSKLVCRGELLFTLPRVKLIPRKDGKPAHNYQLASDTAVTLFCTEDDVVPISDYGYHLLSGVKSREARYGVFQKNILDWGSKLKEGDFVYVALPSKILVPKHCALSVIKYIGPLPNEHGMLFGVEIQEDQYRNQGSSNGFFGGEQYFECDENCALFVSLDRLSPLKPVQQDPPPELPPTADPQRQHQMMTPSQSTVVGLDEHIMVGGENRTIVEEKKATAINHTSLSPVDPKTRLLTRNIAEMMDLAENYEKSMEELNLKVQQMNDELQLASNRAAAELAQKQLEIIKLELKHEQTLKKQTQQSEAYLSQRLKEQQEKHQQAELELQQEIQEARQLSTQFQERLHEVVEEKEQLQVRLQQQLREQQDQHQQVEMRLQQEVREVRQRLREATDERQQFQARVETAVAFIRGDPLTTQVGFDAIELWELPREDVHVSNKILGTGGWGYVAEGTFRGQKVAVKCLHRGILSQFTTNHVRREISIMAQVRHPNLVLLIGAVLNADTGPLVITELLDRTLRSAYEDHALEEQCKFPILRDIASALNYLHAHRRPIIHRDVSSSNVLLLGLRDGNWLAKLSDFGSANLIRAATTPAEGAVIYSAPEVSTDQRIPQTTKVDVYSFGVLVCEVTLCRLPPDPRDFPAYLDTLERDADDRIYRLAKNCTKRNPEERLTMQEVLEQIDQFLQ